MRKTAAFLTLGCKVNQYETDAMRELFVKDGYEVRDFDQQADVYVINTCTVTNIADRKSRQMLHRARKKNPDSIIVAAGCYVQAAEEALKEDPMVDIVIGNNLKSRITEIVAQFMEDRRKTARVRDISRGSEYETMEISEVSEHTRAYIKIQDGCNQFCSYCIIPYARGRVRSRLQEDILKEITGLARKGYKEYVLTGIHISSYGLDFARQQPEGIMHTDPDADMDQDPQAVRADNEEDYGPFASSALIGLIEAIAEIPGVERIRLGSLEPRIITRDFVTRLAAIPQICPHFHLSLQSGCDETLRRMNRHYTTELFEGKCKLLREVFDKPALTTDVIVGFAGETEEEFARTVDFLEKIRFAQMHVFKYSKRKGTRAASMPHQVDPRIQAERSDVLLEMTRRQYKDYVRSLVGEKIRVLLEEEVEIGGVTYMTGLSRRYVRCVFEKSNLTENTIISGVIVSELTDEYVFCERID